MIDRRLLIVTGKGGSGRSAVSVALAIRAGWEGRRVLLISMTDSIGLSIHLGRREIGYEPVEIQPGMSALAIDRPKALDEYLRLQLHVPLNPAARSFAVLAETVPGIRDAVTIGKVAFETWSDNWDLVIADGPPLGQIESYLGAPATVAGLVPSGRVQRQAAAMEDLLANDAEAGLVITTLPEELAVTETLESLERLEADPLSDVAAVITNRVLEPLGADPATLAPGPAREAAEMHTALVEAQRDWMTKLPPGPTLPYLFGLMTPEEVAARLADALP